MCHLEQISTSVFKIHYFANNVLDIVKSMSLPLLFILYYSPKRSNHDDSLIDNF